ncbi:hypothetical protein Q31a_47940 [Aureliella helgolandensis]|uniref:Uncharacterized protein n=1 Tax=Aureliella helgolandensis TaxID=2527968 RepID=A0A518GCZ4_9BACT|nr:hypothetical protein Q31a_47940 [Aureliella helgolandensis]
MSASVNQSKVQSLVQVLSEHVGRRCRYNNAHWGSPLNTRDILHATSFEPTRVPKARTHREYRKASSAEQDWPSLRFRAEAVNGTFSDLRSTDIAEVGVYFSRIDSCKAQAKTKPLPPMPLTLDDLRASLICKIEETQQ